MNSTFAYVYDERLAEKKYERELSRFEAELARFGIGGRIARMTLFRKPEEIVEDALRQGSKHIVIVGDDDTLLRMMWFLPALEGTFGFAPLLGSNRLAGLLGIPSGLKSAAILAGRLAEALDVGQIGDRFFLSDAVMPDTAAELEVEERYRIRPTEGGTITLTNVGKTNPNDGMLEVSVKTADEKKRSWFSQVARRKSQDQTGETRLRLATGHVRSETPVSLIVDGQSMVGTSFGIKVHRKKFRMIVGKGRKRV